MSYTALYPLKFTPLAKYRIWGGNKLNTVLQKGFTEENIGESWEISGVPGDETLVSEGNLAGKSLQQLLQEYQDKLVGKHVYDTFQDQFPLLIKFIDAKTPLSVQVHPHDAIAKERHHSFGKNEMWYVMDAEEDAEIIVGFQTELTKERYTEFLNNDQILNVLNSVKTKAGDTFYIPTGRVHAIGAGVLLAEIQQTSDITYRIYDYNRVDKATGKTRELHNDLALDVIDFEVHDNYKTSYDLAENQSNPLIYSPYFKSNILRLTQPITKDYITIDSFVIYICTNGSFDLVANQNTYSLQKGETILIPASLKNLKLLPCDNAEILEVFY
ncbi:MAG: type I phosphomannose isomerase catalytic subunit [Flavobacterium sp.]